MRASRRRGHPPCWLRAGAVGLGGLGVREIRPVPGASESNDEDDDIDPAVEPGKLDRRWCDKRLLCTAQLTGDFALPSHRETLPTLAR